MAHLLRRPRQPIPQKPDVANTTTAANSTSTSPTSADISADISREEHSTPAHTLPRTSPLSHERVATPQALRIRFWGVRGSYPVSFPTGTRYGGATTCLEIDYGRHILIFDAGTGIIALGEALTREWSSLPPTERPTLSLLFTHAHHDHLCGFPFFAPLFQPDADIHLAGPDLAGLRFEEILAGYMRSPYFPVDFYDLPARRHLRSLHDGARLVWTTDANEPALWDTSRPIPPDALVVDALHTAIHPRDGTIIYRISAGERSVVFATDVEAGNRHDTAGRQFIRFARGADLLIHDAQYSEDDYSGPTPHRGYGHSTPVMAAKVAQAAEVGQLILFHHDPTYTDAEVQAVEHAARAFFPQVSSAREGIEIYLDAPASRHV